MPPCRILSRLKRVLENMWFKVKSYLQAYIFVVIATMYQINISLSLSAWRLLLQPSFLVHDMQRPAGSRDVNWRAWGPGLMLKGQELFVPSLPRGILRTSWTFFLYASVSSVSHCCLLSEWMTTKSRQTWDQTSSWALTSWASVSQSTNWRQ